MSGALLDTSVVIGDLEAPAMPEAMAISVITLGELRAGVRLAGDPAARAVRQARLNAVRDAFEPIPVDEAVAEHYGDVLAAARSAGRTTKATDLLIVATAAATGRTLLTLDAQQAALARAAGISVRSSA
ncbi:MAG: PIN domain-containing protein [Solirubrobacteraceae bacterium]